MQLNLLIIIRRITWTLEHVSSSLAMRWASRLFFSPRETQRLVPDIPDLKQSWCHYSKTNGRQSKVRVYSAGSGPAVLLVHGWEGAAYSHSILATKLLDEGFSVVLFDMPAHGMSPDKITNVAEVSDIIHHLAENEGGFHALIGHSFGAACEGYAIQQGLETKYFVSIAAPTKVSFMIKRFCKIIGASNKIEQGLIKQIDDILGLPHEQASLDVMAAGFTVEGLILHDHKDQTVPYRYAKEFAAAWPDAQFVSTDGLGHSKILRDSEVVQCVAKFLK